MARGGLGSASRLWRRFRRRPLRVQVVSVVVVLAFLGGLVYVVAAGSTPAHSGSSTTVTPAALATGRPSSNSAGVTAHTINVVFPVSNL